MKIQPRFFNPISYEKPIAKECFFEKQLLYQILYSLHKSHFLKIRVYTFSFKKVLRGPSIMQAFINIYITQTFYFLLLDQY